MTTTAYTKAPRYCPCGERIFQEGWGRPRKYCSDACKAKAYRQRKATLLTVSKHRKEAEAFFSSYNGRCSVTKVGGSAQAGGIHSDSAMTPAVRQALEAAAKALKG